MMRRRILIVSLPSQGHINPSLQLAKLLIRAAGVHVTFFTSFSAGTRMSKSPNLVGLDFATFSDGYDDGCKRGDDADRCMSQIERLGSQALTELVIASINEGRPFSCLIYGVQIPWAAEVARSLRIPAAVVWTQPATVFDIYYYYFNGYEEVINDPSSSIELPGLPLLTSGDLPSFLAPQEMNIYKFALPGFQKHVEMLNCERNPIVLVNSFDALESDALGAIKKFNLMGIGPLIPSAFLDGKDPSDTSFGADLFRGSNEYIQWLNSKPKSSVVYVSFGSLSVLSPKQAEEMGRGLLDGGRPFLWVMRMEEIFDHERTLSCHEELEQKGMIVPWCCQVDVLSHPSIGCFVTHGGWNSTIESLSFGLPVVAFPQWSDQPTNAKLIQDVWKTGVRVMVNEEGIVEAGEIKRCVDLVMGSGERGEDMRSNAKKWKGLAREAVKEGGSSDKNLKNFINEIIQQSYD